MRQHKFAILMKPLYALNGPFYMCIVWGEVPEFVIVLIYSHGNVVTIIAILFPWEKVEDHRKPGFTLIEKLKGSVLTGIVPTCRICLLLS